MTPLFGKAELVFAVMIRNNSRTSSIENFKTKTIITMKHNLISMFKGTRLVFMATSFAALALLSSCSDDPEPENVPELITKATLTFTPVGGGTTVTVNATDPDGEGVQDIVVDGPINLVRNKSYTLTVALINELVDPSDAEYNITDEVEEEGDEHMFFYSWTNNVFSDPTGNGNVDNRADDVNYNDEDENGLPLGLNTSWTTVDAAASGSFRIILKHQPDLKSATSSATDGETDLDLSFTISVN
jgi:hypothetical protein